MPYNRDIKARAPLPIGALPTDEELDQIINQANKERAYAVARGILRLFGPRR